VKVHSSVSPLWRTYRRTAERVRRPARSRFSAGSTSRASRASEMPVRPGRTIVASPHVGRRIKSVLTKTLDGWWSCVPLSSKGTVSTSSSRGIADRKVRSGASRRTGSSLRPYVQGVRWRWMLTTHPPSSLAPDRCRRSQRSTGVSPTTSHGRESALPIHSPPGAGSEGRFRAGGGSRSRPTIVGDPAGSPADGSRTDGALLGEPPDPPTT
jgi:hypothetical protein